jgi:tetratricopeptide (TPR) repeat protein
VRFGIAAAAIGVGLVAVFALEPFLSRFSGEFPAPRESVRRVATARSDFVGAERCADCHAAEYSVWRNSTHGLAGGAPSPRLVIAAFNGAPFGFANAQVTPRIRDGVYEFVVRQPGEPPQTLRVDGVVGGGHMYAGGTQGFVTDRGDGTWRFLPFEWSRQSRAWFCNTNSRVGKGWVPITTALRLEDCGDWPPIRVLGDHPRFSNCQSCHASQAIVTLDSAPAGGRYNTRITSLAINCESCHGPGLRHVELAERGALSGADVGFTALATADKDASLAVCYQCHAVKDRLRPGFASGDPLTDYYSIKLPLLGERPLHPDGRIRTFAYQEGHQYSDCYRNGGMTCVSCHDPHSQQYRSVTGETLAGRFSDKQCTSCHLSKAEYPAQHTKHQAQSASCVSCHMPARQEPETRALNPRYANGRVVPYARSDHTISIPRPQLDSALGLASACAPCHAGMSTSQLAQTIRALWGDLKPLPATVAAQLRVEAGMPAASAAALLLGDTADAGERHAFARFAGISRFLETYVNVDTDLSPEVESRLRQLATSTDADVRAAALATLHLAKGGTDRGVRRTLAAALRAADARDAALRDRWTVLLGFAGDRYAERGDFGNAIAAYTRALEVQPSNAELALSLANAQRNAGNAARAVTSYQRSIASDPRAPLAWVNLGIALTELGDVQGAATALLRATALDANEPLAWFNLANLLYVQRDLGRAGPMYERVVALDPSIVPAHFQLARVSLLAGDSVAALRHLRRGLAFDSSDAQARQMAAFLTNRPVSGTRARP